MYLVIYYWLAANTNFIAFGLTRPDIEPAIYRTRDRHSNYHTTDMRRV